MKIYLSPSNQNNNPYSYGNTNEMEQCNRVAVAAQTYLEKYGFEVKRAPKGQDMYKSINESNAWGANLHICIHTNAGGGKGCEVYTYRGIAPNKWAKAIYAEIAAITVSDDRGLKTAGFAELVSTNAPAVYIEAEFHDNATGAKWIVDNTTLLGMAIANGVAKAEGVTTEVETNPQPETESTLMTLKTGQAITLKNEPLYGSSDATNRAGTINGTYFVWSAEVVRGRVRITNAKTKAGISGQVTGWIAAPKVAQSTYTVKEGDTLSKVATQLKTTVTQLAKSNDIILKADQVLKISK